MRNKHFIVIIYKYFYSFIYNQLENTEKSHQKKHYLCVSIGYQYDVKTIRFEDGYTISL